MQKFSDEIKDIESPANTDDFYNMLKELKKFGYNRYIIIERHRLS